MISLIIALLPYCTPAQSDYQLAGCLSHMIICTSTDTEENCAENIPVEFWPK